MKKIRSDHCLRSELMYGSTWLLSVLFHGVIFLTPGLPSAPIHFAETGTMGWVEPLAPWRLVGLALSLILPLMVWRAQRGLKNTASDKYRWLVDLAPLGALPLLWIPYWIPAAIPYSTAGNLLFFGSLTLLAWSTLRFILSIRISVQRPGDRLIIFGLFCLMTVFYTAGGTWISLHFGEHYVDEGHYLIQAKSLKEDGDLDIRNNFGFDVDQAIQERVGAMTNDTRAIGARVQQATLDTRNHLHISHRSPPDRWFSWHPYGLALLLAPVMDAPLWLRQGVLAVISSTGILFMYQLCLVMGRSRRWSLAILILFSLTTYWFIYSVRALPEMLGATLFAIGLFAAVQANKRPVIHFCLMALSCVCMAIAHPRFLPAAGLIVFLFFIRSVCKVRPAKPVIIFYAVVSAAGLGALGLYLMFNHAAYSSLTSYPLSGLFGAYPEGSWLLLFSERGLIFGIPAAAVLLAGSLYGITHDAEHRSVHLVGAAGFLGLLMVLGSTDCWDGGPTLYGRYLLVSLPALLPGLVFLAERSRPAGQFFILLLLFASAAFTFIGLYCIDMVGITLLRLPWQAIRLGVPQLSQLFFPYQVSDIMIGWPYHGWQAFHANLFSLALLAGSLVICWPGASGRPLLVTLRLAGVLILFITGYIFHQAHGREINRWPPDMVEKYLAKCPVRNASLTNASDKKYDLFELSNRFHRWRPASLTTEDLGARNIASVYVQPRIEENDWAGRKYRWFTLAAPFDPGRGGPRAFRMTGQLEGDSAIDLVIKQGGKELYESRISAMGTNESFTVDAVVDTENFKGHIYLLARIEGDGRANFEKLFWSPSMSVYTKPIVETNP